MFDINKGLNEFLEKTEYKGVHPQSDLIAAGYYAAADSIIRRAWKDAKETPELNRTVIVEKVLFGVRIVKMIMYNEMSDEYIKEGWSQWAYLTDLMPSKGGIFCEKQDLCKNACPCICDEYCRYEKKF